RIQDQIHIRDSPNIAINTIGGSGSVPELYAVAIFGLLLQAGVLVFDGLVIYHLRWPKVEDGNEKHYVEGYAYPLTAMGTLGIVIGMFICAYICDSSTLEMVWKPKEANLPVDYQFLWLQRSQVVNDQKFQ